jgi:uncharacterized protein
MVLHIAGNDDILLICVRGSGAFELSLIDREVNAMSPPRNLFTVAAALFLLTAGLVMPGPAAADASSQSEENQWLEVNIYRLAMDPLSNQPVVLLSDPLEERVMPIWIGPFEANALNSEMTGIPNLRPQTHDLLETIMNKAGLKLLRTAITHLQGNIYYASIRIESGDTVMEVDSRPSDALVMALKFKAPIFISRSLFMDKAHPLRKEEKEEDLWYEAPGEPI